MECPPVGHLCKLSSLITYKDHEQIPWAPDLVGMIDDIHLVNPSVGEWHVQAVTNLLTSEGVAARFVSECCRIDVDPDGPCPALSFVHELGHIIARGIGNPFWAVDQGGTSAPAFVEWEAVVRKSAGYQQLEYLDVVATAIEQMNGRFDGSGYQYVLTLHETWARSYAQYISLRSQSTLLTTELAKMLESDSAPQFWTSDDFSPIAQQHDQSFKMMGWLINR